MATIQDINVSIINGTFTNEQLDSIIMAVKFARGQLTKQNTRSLTIGTRVKWSNSKTGQTMIGTVSEVKRKFVHVRTPNSVWRVPANMLTMAAEA